MAPGSAPIVTGISPSYGPVGTLVTITGSNFYILGTVTVTGITFGGTAATSWNRLSDVEIQVYAPNATTSGDIIVTTTGGVSAASSADVFTYAPVVTGLSQHAGTSATLLVITGTGFTGVSSVMFGGLAAAAYLFDSDTQIRAYPNASGTGTVDVIITTSAGGPSATSAADLFTYTSSPNPVVSSVSPTSGPTGGGTQVTIYGANFTGATAVYFGGTAATSFSVVLDSEITAYSPAESAGTVHITVTNSHGTSATSSADQFTYFTPISISSVGVVGFIPPANYQTPQVYGTLSPTTTGYTVTGLTWSPADSAFQPLGSYVATVTLTADSTHTFPSGGITGIYTDSGCAASAGVTSGTGTGNTLSFTVTFPMYLGISVSVEQTPSEKMMSATLNFDKTVTGGRTSPIYYKQFPIVIPDYLGNPQQVFLGMVPSSEQTYGAEGSYESLTAYEFSWYLTKQHLDNATLVLATPTTQGSAIFVQYNLTYNNANTGFYAYVGETITGATSGSTGMLVSFDSSNFILQYCSGSEFLAYASGTGAFTSGLTVTGATSGAQGIITAISGTTSSGTLTLTPIKGIFSAGETITDTGTGSAEATGAQNFFTSGEALKVNGAIVAYATGHTTSLGSPTPITPVTWLYAVLGGTNYANITGISTDETHWTGPSWSDSSTPVATEFDFDPNGTKTDAIAKIVKYLGYIWVVKNDYYSIALSKNVPYSVPTGYFIPFVNIDNTSGGLDLPPAAAINYPDPHLVSGIKLTQQGDEKYNKVTVRCLTLYKTQLQAQAMTSGVNAGTEKPIEYLENNNSLTNQTDLNSYAAGVLAYYQSQIMTWTVTFNLRSDLRIYQILLINGYDTLGIPSQSVGSPYDLGYRIVGIKYDFDQAGTINTVTCTIIPVRQFAAFIALSRVFPNSANNIRAVVQNELSKTPRTYTGTTVLNDAGVVQMLTDSGQVINVQDGSV